jgi:hypothetical protein
MLFRRERRPRLLHPEGGPQAVAGGDEAVRGGAEGETYHAEAAGAGAACEGALENSMTNGTP